MKTTEQHTCPYCGYISDEPLKIIAHREKQDSRHIMIPSVLYPE